MIKTVTLIRDVIKLTIHSKNKRFSKIISVRLQWCMRKKVCEYLLLMRRT